MEKRLEGGGWGGEQGVVWVGVGGDGGPEQGAPSEKGREGTRPGGP